MEKRAKVVVACCLALMFLALAGAGVMLSGLTVSSSGPCTPGYPGCSGSGSAELCTAGSPGCPVHGGGG